MVLVFGKLKGKAVPLHYRRAYRGSRGIAPLILNLCPRWSWVVNINHRSLCARGRAPDAHWVGGWRAPEPAWTFFFFFFGGATARGGPWPPLQYASRPACTSWRRKMTVVSGRVRTPDRPTSSMFCIRFVILQPDRTWGEWREFSVYLCTNLVVFRTSLLQFLNHLL